MASLTWLGHSSFRLDLGSIVYFDPYKVNGKADADLILVSHGHHDHCDKASISSLLKDGSAIICPKSCQDNVGHDATTMQEGEVLDVWGLKVEACAAYNLRKPNHPRGMGLGYVVESDDLRYYFAGDTDFIPEMGDIGKIHIAMLPVGGTYTMDWKEAGQVVRVIQPDIAIPMHYGEVVGSQQDAERFKRKVETEAKIKVIIPKVGEEIEV